jgi:hypothetical protein
VFDRTQLALIKKEMAPSAIKTARMAAFGEDKHPIFFGKTISEVLPPPQKSNLSAPYPRQRHTANTGPDTALLWSRRRARVFRDGEAAT